MNIEKISSKQALIFDLIVFLGSLIVIGFWLAGKPLLYTTTGPVMSIFTAFSLLLMSVSKLARRLLFGWPLTLSMAILVLTLGGNLSSILMLVSVPQILVKSTSSLVVTSIMTSTGIILFCLYELLNVLRKTPKSAFIIDDILLHLALVPGGLSLLGHLLQNPAYLSMEADPRIGISLLEMGFMAAFATSSLLSNKNLFLWEFLAANWSNRIIFLALFANQFVAPIVVAFAFSNNSDASKTPGLELFIMLGGVLTTLSFLFLQAYNQRNKIAK